MSHGWSEADLADLRSFFYCEGRHAALASFCGASLITHPDNLDPNQQALYAGCQELERRGLVQSRVLPDGRSVVFFGPRDREWDQPAREDRTVTMTIPFVSDADIYAILGIPAELLRNDKHPNRS